MIQNAWFNKAKWVWLLLPLTLLFWCLSGLRRVFYALGLLKQSQGPLPLIVVGNISVGGNGKTPLTIALVEYLRSRGHRPAVLSRGYGGSQSSFPHRVTPGNPASLVGDEPALISQRLDCIVVIDPKRVRGCEYIAHTSDADIIICDDGLQHYAMARTVELCVVDSRGLGNGYLLPMGPLREGKWRLNTVDAIVFNQGFDASISAPEAILSATSPCFNMHLAANVWVNLKTKARINASEKDKIKSVLANKSLSAIAGIGDPQRFFNTIESLGISPQRLIPFADHHAFSAQDLPNTDIVLMTEKDAVKCASFAHEGCWYLQIQANLPDAFFDSVIPQNLVAEKDSVL